MKRYKVTKVFEGRFKIEQRQYIFLWRDTGYRFTSGIDAQKEADELNKSDSWFKLATLLK